MISAHQGVGLDWTEVAQDRSQGQNCREHVTEPS